MDPLIDSSIKEGLRWLQFTLLGQAKDKISQTEKAVLIVPQVRLAR
jgi:hypothetical protein